MKHCENTFVDDREALRRFDILINCKAYFPIAQLHLILRNFIGPPGNLAANYYSVRNAFGEKNNCLHLCIVFLFLQLLASHLLYSLLKETRCGMLGLLRAGGTWRSVGPTVCFSDPLDDPFPVFQPSKEDKW